MRGEICAELGLHRHKNQKRMDGAEEGGSAGARESARSNSYTVHRPEQGRGSDPRNCRRDRGVNRVLGHMGAAHDQDAQDLELAYAITVHKSQGSEFEAVVLPLFRNTPHLCYRNLLYTAVTRAKSLLVMVGSMETLQKMIDNDRKILRYTGLRTFLRRAGELPL